jgi:hypothetical protein
MESIQHNHYPDMTVEEIDTCIERELEIYRRAQQRIEELYQLREERVHPEWKLYREMFSGE